MRAILNSPHENPRWRLTVGAMALASTGVLGSTGALADDPPPFNAMCGELRCRIERTEATWQLRSVDDLRFLDLTYESGGCRLGNGVGRVLETASRIRIAVDQREIVAADTPDGKPVRTDELMYRKLTVLLDRPVGGRRVVGGPRIRERGKALRSTRIEHGRVIPLVPGVVDLAKRDAYTVLGSQGFKARRIGRSYGSVSFQTPLGGKRAPANTVRLTVGRELFAAKALKACISRTGLKATAIRPKPGELNAPDLELRLYDPGLSAFVALFADPVRAKENVPEIRRNARGLRLEHRKGAVTVWVRWPGAKRASQVRRCVTGKLGRPTVRPATH